MTSPFLALALGALEGREAKRIAAEQEAVKAATTARDEADRRDRLRRQEAADRLQALRTLVDLAGTEGVTLTPSTGGPAPGTTALPSAAAPPIVTGALPIPAARPVVAGGVPGPLTQMAIGAPPATERPPVTTGTLPVDAGTIAFPGGPSVGVQVDLGAARQRRELEKQRRAQEQDAAFEALHAARPQRFPSRIPGIDYQQILTRELERDPSLRRTDPEDDPAFRARKRAAETRAFELFQASKDADPVEVFRELEGDRETRGTLRMADLTRIRRDARSLPPDVSTRRERLLKDVVTRVPTEPVEQFLFDALEDGISAQEALNFVATSGRFSAAEIRTGERFFKVTAAGRPRVPKQTNPRP